jgi:hypothetical protein
MPRFRIKFATPSDGATRLGNPGCDSLRHEIDRGPSDAVGGQDGCDGMRMRTRCAWSGIGKLLYEYVPQNICTNLVGLHDTVKSVRPPRRDN